jgi:chromosome segregation ATPase
MTNDTVNQTPSESWDHVLATYREIASRFGLGGPNAARTKVKRAGWKAEPSNHPADPLRVRVPRDAWDQAAETQNRMPRERRNLEPRQPPYQKNHDTRNINALEMALNVAREQLKREQIKTLELEQELETARETIVELREERVGAQARVEALNVQVEHLARILRALRLGADGREQAEIRRLTERAAELREQRAAATAQAEASESRVSELTAGLEALREQMAGLREERAALIAKAEAAEMRVDDQAAEVRMLWEGRAAAQAKADLLQVELDQFRAEAEGRVKESGSSAVSSDGPKRRFWRLWPRRS